MAILNIFLILMHFKKLVLLQVLGMVVIALVLKLIDLVLLLCL